MLLGGLRRHHAFAESGRGIPGQWRQFEPLIGQIPGQVGATTYGAMCGSDASGFEYMCAVEVESFSALPAELGRMRIAAQQYAVFLHQGQIAAIQATWGRILNEWLPNCGYPSANKPDFEVYDRRFDPRTGLGDVEIWIAISGRR
jgi:predicted transcriptional regulator YdeE